MRLHTSTFPGEQPTPVPGQLALDGTELRAPTALERTLWTLCCGEALVVTPHDCVCSFKTACPNHGLRHNGTHD